MPFTPTHVLAIVPCAAYCRWLPFSALAIGCMIPDLPQFFPAVTYAQTHSLFGPIVVCMPLGLMAYMLFQYVLKVPLIALLPLWMQARMTAYSRPPQTPTFAFLVGVVIALILGAYSHIVWDAFTHQGRWGTRLIPWLNQEFLIAGRSVPAYKLFQYGSTFVGLPLLLLLWERKLRRTQPAPINHVCQLKSVLKFACWGILLLVPSLLALTKLLGKSPFHQKLFYAITSSGAALVMLAVGYSLLYRVIAMQINQSDKQTENEQH